MHSVDSETLRALNGSMERHGYLRFPSSGESMYPFITDGNVGTFVKFDVHSARHGDIVLFVSRDQCLVAHRIVRVDHHRDRIRLLTKGDTNLFPDGWISEHQVLGKLVLVEKQRVCVHTDSRWARLWGNVIVSFPVVTRLLRRWLRWTHTWNAIIARRARIKKSG